MNVRERLDAAVEVGRDLAHEWTADRVPGLAAEVAFFAILSLFPAALALASLLSALDGILGAEVAADVQDSVLSFLRDVLTSEAEGTIDAVADLFENRRPGLATLSALGAFWGLSRAFAAVVRALDVVYDLDEVRPWLKIRAVAVGLALGSTVAAAVVLAFIVVGPLLGSGEDLADRMGAGDAFAFLWDVLRPPLAFLVLVGWAATVFHVAPDHRTPWRHDLPGALLTASLWALFSLALRLYLSLVPTANQVFGALGGALVVLVWLWLLALGLMVGGELNQVLLNRRNARSDGAQATGSGGPAAVRERPEPPATPRRRPRPFREKRRRASDASAPSRR